jgi:hypothetical protein
MSTDFIARWSRRKRGVDPSPVPPLDPQAQSLAAPGAEAREGSDQPVDPVDDSTEAEGAAIPAALTAEDLADLPDPEELTAASDITGFLRSGVPAALRNRALRRMWSIDPDIRDAIGDARDYAWDWNIPGGMPVSGPIPASIDVDKMVRGIFGTDRVQEEIGPDPEAPPGEIQQPADNPVEEPVAPSAERPDPLLVAAETPGAEAAGVDPDPSKDTPPAAPQARPLRHGGALPS